MVPIRCVCVRHGRARAAVLVTSKWCPAFDAKFCERQVDGTAVRADNQAIAALQAEFGIGWVDGLTVGTTHSFLVFRLVYSHL